MGGPCFNGGESLDECLLTGEKMNRTDRYPEFLGLQNSPSLILVCEYNPQGSKARISICDKEDGELFSEKIFSDVCREYALNYLNHRI